MRKTTEERFWSKVNKTESCWVWTGAKIRSKCAFYSSFKSRGKQRGAHRYSYELYHKRELSDAESIDHLCRNTLCVNPHHLEAVSPRENTLRGTGPSALNAKKTHCLRGHSLTPENLLAQSEKTGWRLCKVCAREWARADYRKRHPGSKVYKARVQ